MRRRSHAGPSARASGTWRPGTGATARCSARCRLPLALRHHVQAAAKNSAQVPLEAQLVDRPVDGARADAELLTQRALGGDWPVGRDHAGVDALAQNGGKLDVQRLRSFMIQFGHRARLPVSRLALCAQEYPWIRGDNQGYPPSTWAQ